MIGTHIYVKAAGGVQEAARQLGVHRATVSRWQRDGIIPSKYQRAARIIVERHLLEVQLATGTNYTPATWEPVEGTEVHGRKDPLEGV